MVLAIDWLSKVELLEVGRLSDTDTDGIDDRSALFVTSHAWALESATHVTIIAVDDPDGRRVKARFASSSALVAMKLHAIQDRSDRAASIKRGSDAWDLFRLLSDLDNDGAVSGGFADASSTLRRLTLDAAQRVLVDGANRTVGWMRIADVGITADELRYVATRFIEAID